MKMGIKPQEAKKSLSNITWSASKEYKFKRCHQHICVLIINYSHNITIIRKTERYTSLWSGIFKYIYTEIDEKI